MNCRTVDGLASASVSIGEVTSLEHELRDHTVEDGALVMQRFALLADALLAGAQSTEVL